MAEDNIKPEGKQTLKKGYGKRPLWFWILIYVIAAIIIYGLIYLIWFHHTGSSKSGTNTSSGYGY